MNPLFDQLSKGNQSNDLVRRFNQFKNSFSGNPQEQIQRLLNSGKVTQDQYNRAVQQAQMLGKLLGMK